ncbi:MAG: NAD(P)H-dependent glycerol-3-phosphate dehydrogenase [Hyphomicrobiales bacterium]
MTDISVIGGGAWGTALAASIARKGQNPTLWARDTSVIEDIRQQNQNIKFLEGIPLPAGIQPTADPADMAGADILLVVIPAQAIRSILEKFREIIKPTATLVLCAKGIESTTGKRVSEITREVMPNNPIAVLSGPSFADDVARGLPTAVTLAAPSLEVAARLAEAISSPALRLYASNDIIGVELGGALKNIIALAIGIARAKKLGASAEAALTTRGFAELARIAQYFGAQPETLMGLSCLGDLMLTCSSPQSRNFAYGMAMGAGDNLSSMKLAEGVHTTGIAAQLCRDANIDAPIIDAVDSVLSQKIDITEAMTQLLSRPLKVETI